MTEEIRLGFKLQGNPQGKPLCLVHGWGCDSSFLLPIAFMFPERAVYLIDLPGYGQSMGLAALSADFEGSVEALARTIPPGADVMAASMGALYAIKALSLPCLNVKADSLVTICSNARFPRDPNWPGLSADLLYRCRTMLTPRRCRRLIHLFLKLQMLDNNGAQNDFLRRTFVQCQLPDFKTLMNGIGVASFADVREDLKNLKVPCLQLYGAKDRLVPAALTYALNGDELRSSFIFVNSAHNPYLTEPALFEKVVRDFFDKVHTFLR